MCFSDTFPLNVLNIFEMWLPFFQIRSCPHLQENSSGRKVKQLFIRASIQTQGALLRLLCLREVVQLCSAAEDLIRLRAGLTRLQAMKTIQAVPAVSHTWLEPANVTAVAQPCASDGSQKWRSISGISKAVLVSLCYLISSRLQTFCGGLVFVLLKYFPALKFFLLALNVSLWVMAIPTA